MKLARQLWLLLIQMEMVGSVVPCSADDFRAFADAVYAPRVRYGKMLGERHSRTLISHLPGEGLLLVLVLLSFTTPRARRIYRRLDSLKLAGPEQNIES